MLKIKKEISVVNFNNLLYPSTLPILSVQHSSNVKIMDAVFHLQFHTNLWRLGCIILTAHLIVDQLHFQCSVALCDLPSQEVSSSISLLQILCSNHRGLLAQPPCCPYNRTNTFLPQSVVK